jgi:hypothetical protein
MVFPNYEQNNNDTTNRYIITYSIMEKKLHLNFDYKVKIISVLVNQWGYLHQPRFMYLSANNNIMNYQ